MSPRAIRNIDGFRFFFFSKENGEPPHIHVEKGNGTAKWWLTPEPRMVYSNGYNAGEERKIERLVKKRPFTSWFHSRCSATGSIASAFR
ncbi:MAG: DUF4160 domain-containing protein [Flavobacteriales bacterium]|nr:DUF4160 domain-containing protein [Flavobacteriales bacterium]